MNWKKKTPLNNESGIAALMMVVFTIVIMAAISFQFIAENQSKQSGSALAITSAQAFSIAEAGIEYAEACLNNDDGNCPCSPTCSTWTGLADMTNINFGPSGGSFTVNFTDIDANNVTATSTGTYNSAVRVVSKVCTKPACKLTINAVTTCSLAQDGGVTVIGTTEDLDNSSPLCPDPNLISDPPSPPGGPDINNNCNGASGDFGKWDHNDGSTCTITGPQTITIQEKFSMKDSSKLIINGDVIFELGNEAIMESSAVIEVNGTLKFHVKANLTIIDSIINTTSNIPTDVLIMANNEIKISENSQIVGALISDETIEIKGTSQITGAMIGKMVDLKDTTTTTHNFMAGNSVSGYDSSAIGCL